MSLLAGLALRSIIQESALGIPQVEFDTNLSGMAVMYLFNILS